MHLVSPPPNGGRIAFRCDGDGQIGAGHVARCLPLASAFAQIGWPVSFIGRYEGLASWLLKRAAHDVREPEPDSVCGVPAAKYEAAVVDSYDIDPVAICGLARTLPVATLAEARRCPTAGILLDYHLDRTEPPSPVLLAGPSFAPIDPGFAGAGRAGSEVRTVLVTVGGSLAARSLLAQILPMVGAAFPEAGVLLAGAAPPDASRTGSGNVLALPSPSALVDVVPEVDLTVTAAGFTAYEMACAGLPQVAVAIVENQRRVVKGLREKHLAPCLDLAGGESLAELPSALEQLRDPDARRRFTARGRSVFDGGGARRAAIALSERFEAGAQSRADNQSAGS